MPTLYYAGPLFTAAERDWNAGNVERLRRVLAPTTVLVPQEFCAALDQVPGPRDYGAIFRACVDHLHGSDAVLAILDGPDGDSGTAWEMGYAFARGIPVIGLRTDWRPAEDGSSNCMLSRGCRRVVRDLDGALGALQELLGVPLLQLR